MNQGDQFSKLVKGKLKLLHKFGSVALGVPRVPNPNPKPPNPKPKTPKPPNPDRNP